MKERVPQFVPVEIDPYPTLKFLTEKARDSYITGIRGYFFHSRPEPENKDGFFLIHLHPNKLPLRRKA